MEKSVSFQNSKGSHLAGILTEPDNHKFILVMAHGFSSSKNTINFVKLAERLVQKGIATFRFDFFGHGNSDGLFENITATEAVNDILQAIKFVKSQGYEKVGLLGSSFGGLASIMAASKTNDLSFLALKSPVSDYFASEKSIYSQTQLDKWQKDGFTDYIDQSKHLKLNYSYIVDMPKHDAYATAKNISVPTLVVHGNQDEEVPYTQSQKLIQCLPNSKLITIDGADHRYTTESHAQQMLEAITNFVVENSR